MKLIFIVIIFFTYTIVGYSQNSEIKYYNNKWLEKQVVQKKAKYCLISTVSESGVVTNEVRSVKANEIIKRVSHLNNEPVGIWLIKEKDSLITLDYSFDLEYCVNKNIDSTLYRDINRLFQNIDSIEGYINPKSGAGSGEGEGKVTRFINKNLMYPDYAINYGLHGVVYVYIYIDNSGEINDVCIFKGVHAVLDKEAMRVVSKIEFAKIKGNAKGVCTIIPIYFQM